MMKEQLNLFVEGLQQFLNEIASALPKILGAIFIFIIGWIIAKLFKRLFMKLLKATKFNYLTEKSGIDKFLQEGGVKTDAIAILGTLLYWVIMLIIIMATLNSLNLTAVSLVFNEIMLYVPNIIVAVVILIIGIYFARVLSQITKTSLKSMQEKTSNLISQIVYIAVIVLTIFLTLGQLNIAGEIVASSFQIIFGAICLALALAFGLGGKHKAAEILEEFLKRDK